MGAYASAAQQCVVDAQACTISISGGTINTCSLDSFQYQYDATGTVQNIVSGLQVDTSYNIRIENVTQGTEQNISANSNSDGVLEFSS